MTSPQELQNRARAAAVDFANSQSVGDLVETIDEGDNVTTFLFASKQKGYVGWNFSVSVFAAENEITVSEVNLMPGESALLAPKWIPWSERLADYRALQAELEAQAAAEAAEEESEAEESEQAEAAEVVAEEIEVEVTETASATELADESVDAEENSDDAGKRPPRFLRRRLGRLKNKKDKS